MPDRTPARARPWQRVRRALGAIVAPILARVARILARSLPAATLAPIHSTGDRTMSDHTSTPHQHAEHGTSDTRPDQTSAPSSGRTAAAPRSAVRHLRFDVVEWRRAATRAARDGRGVAEVVGALVRAYGAGEIDAPAPIRTPVRPEPDDRTGVRPLPRDSNGRSITPPAGARANSTTTTSTTHHGTPTKDPA